MKIFGFNEEWVKRQCKPKKSSKTAKKMNKDFFDFMNEACEESMRDEEFKKLVRDSLGTF